MIIKFLKQEILSDEFLTIVCGLLDVFYVESRQTTAVSEQNSALGKMAMAMILYPRQVQRLEDK